MKRELVLTLTVLGFLYSHYALAQGFTERLQKGWNETIFAEIRK